MLNWLKQLFSSNDSPELPTGFYAPPQDRLILFPQDDSKENYLKAFWQWIEILESGDYQLALESLFWPRGTGDSPESLEKAIKTFFGGEKPWTVIIPSQKWIDEINNKAEICIPKKKGNGWFMAHIPVTNEPEKRKEDDILLGFLAVSFFVPQVGDQYALERINPRRSAFGACLVLRHGASWFSFLVDKHHQQGAMDGRTLRTGLAGSRARGV